MQEIITEGMNIGKIMGYEEEGYYPELKNSVLVQIGNRIFSIITNFSDYELIKNSTPVGSTVIVESHNGSLCIESL
jgi:hypothetical protein